MNQLTIKSNSHKILAIADLHADEWRFYNNFRDERLNQPLIVADRLCKISRDEGIDTILILGDTFNKPKSGPQVCNIIEKFFVRLSKQFNNILFILGQHDMQSKTMDCEPRDTLMTLMLEISDKIKYCHRTFINYNNVSIYMQNWIPENIIDVPDCHIFCSHVSLGFGQETRGNYKLGVFGDIHTPMDTARDHEISPPVQLYCHQPDIGYYGIINTIDCSFTRHEIDGECLKDNGEVYFHRFLRLKETKQYIDALARGKQLGDNQESIELRAKITSDVYSDINRLVEQNQLKDIHNLIDLTNAPSPISFNFNLLRLEIINFRSIEHFILDFSEWDRVLYANGVNGSGKSSLINSIITALTGNNQMRQFNRRPDDGSDPLQCCIKLSLMYNNRFYMIERGAGWTNFYIDGDDEQHKVSRNKRDLEIYIREELPFVSYINFLTIYPNRHYFDSIDRTQLIKTCFNLDIFDYIYYKACDLVAEKYNQINEINKNIDIQLGMQVNYTNELNRFKDELSRLPKPTESIEDINNKISFITNAKTELSDKYTNLMTCYNEIKSSEKSLGELSQINTNDIELYINKLNLLNEMSSKADKLLEELQGNLSLIRSNKQEIELKNTQINNCESIINNSIEQISLLKSSSKSIPCPHCNTPVSIIDNSSHIKEIESQIESTKLNEASIVKDRDELIEYQKTLDQKYNDTNTEHENLLNDITNYKSELNKLGIDKSKEYYENVLTSINSISDIRNKISQLQIKYNELNKDYSNSKDQVISILNGMKFEEYISSLTNKISKINTYNSMQSRISDYQVNIDKVNELITNYRSDLVNKNNELTRLQKYQSLFNQKDLNSIPFAVLDQVVKSMSSDTVKFSSTRELANGSEKFDVSVSILVGKKWIDYSEASDGQKCILDLFIINRIVNLLGNIGILLMDEAVANVDSGKLGMIANFFDTTNAHKIIYTSHNEALAFGDRELQCELIDGVSQFTWR